MIDSVELPCPHCGEFITIGLDLSEGDHTRIEDCAVCCAPMVVSVVDSLSGKPLVTLNRDNE
ncbi:MAG: CPXCG motif-containing cysteine-rich protein [Pseudomonadota bacterium]|nr:MAG: CPXCG motif-containing cysteine-rich protein [Pseudomonadota bacterium]